ncbi:hypothetical protein NDA13_005412 [Ustilago tritici]|nr:hypothetical protein NDA13_005412 [Ustilago tritici]
MDKRYIPHSVFQDYHAKAKRDGRVFVRRSDDKYGGSRSEFQPAEFGKRSVGEDADDGNGGHWQGGDSSFSSVQELINQAQKTAKCTLLSPADVHCVEQGGKEDMIWWQQAFCKRCSDAGGTNKGEFAGPKARDQDNDATVPGSSDGAKPKEGEKVQAPRTVSGDKPKQADAGIV